MTTRRLSASPTDLVEAARLLAAGDLVAFPTETVYGLGADATDDLAVARIFAAKGRPRFNPLIAHVASVREAAAHVVFDARAHALAARYWPGPLTLVLPRQPSTPLSLLCSAGLDTQAVRAPDHPVALALLRAFGRPLAAPSANPSGRVSPTTAQHVLDGLDGHIAALIDGGSCRVGVESTVLDLSEPTPRLLRPGGVTRPMIEAVLGPIEVGGDAIKAPGMLESHYAPACAVRLDAAEVRPGEALLTFGGEAIGGAMPVAIEHLSRAGDLTEAAAHLFAALRRLDRPDVSGIAVMPVPAEGLGEAINDRLRRAAAPRPG